MPYKAGTASRGILEKSEMKLLATLGVIAVAGLSQAAIYTHTFANDVNSWNEEGDAANVFQTFNLGAGSVITGIGWSVTLNAISPSWRSEMVVSVNGSGTPGLYLSPGIADDLSGTASYSSGGILDLSDNAIPDITVGPSGNVTLEFFEAFDDDNTLVDGRWLAGSTLQFEYQPVPEPATMAALGLGAAALLRRRRK